ncbi:recombinase RitC [Drosophila suzukii associated hytrosavirus 1]|nr:recombinase RitC [Drosophila suzukii associated hytrosavirus 1]
MADDVLVKNISLLCNLNKKFHCKNREHELKSLTRYLKEFKDFTQEEFINFVCRQYIESLRARKRFCSQSIYNRVCAIQSRLDINVLSRRRYTSVLKSLRKLFNPYNNETVFYTNTGSLIKIPPEEFKILRENAKYLIEQNNTSVPDRWVLNTYTDHEIGVVYDYFKQNLENFLSASYIPNNAQDIPFIELCMIIVFNYNTPRRIAEIMNLRLYQIEELILHNTVNIKSKDGFSIDCIYISVSLADLLNRFVMKLYPNAFESFDRDFKVFTSTYKMYYGRMRNVLKVLIGEDRLKNLRIFHGFRNYFANKHLTNDTSRECQRILGHTNASMTRRYARGQRKDNNCEENKKNQVLNYLNKIE